MAMSRELGQTYEIDGIKYKSVNSETVGNCLLDGNPKRWAICGRCRGVMFEIVNAEITCKNCGKGRGVYLDMEEADE